MGVEHMEGRLLAAQMGQQQSEDGMFVDIGEIPGVIGMAIIHALPLP
jgi:hypothetical protein